MACASLTPGDRAARLVTAWADLIVQPKVLGTLMRATSSWPFSVAASTFSPPTKAGEYKTTPRDAPPANPPVRSSSLELYAQCDGPVIIMAPQTRKLNKPLTCFYCNRRSTTKYDGFMRRFECNNCNATNHLDTVSTRGSHT